MAEHAVELSLSSEERDAMETLFEIAEDDLADALDRLGAQ